MRAFYEDEDEKRVFYSKLDNIATESRNKWKMIKANTGKELLEKVIKEYEFNDNVKTRIQIWSNTIASGKGVQLDTMDQIPKEYEFVFVRGLPQN
jgi:hypothetical protein